MNISVIGTGYVGLVTGSCFAEFGLNVLCMDTDEKKIQKLKNGIIPIYEPGLVDIVERNYYFSRRLNFTTDIKQAVAHSAIIFIAVNTPILPDGSSDLQYVSRVAREIALHMTGYKAVVNKSTVPIGTGRLVREEMQGILRQQSKHISFDVVSNPEFLREGTAIKDFIKPDRIVIGAESEKAVTLMKEIYNIQLLIGIPVVITDIETAEMIKHASNAFLAVKISFINEIANICDICGVDAVAVSKAMGFDSRIGPKFLNPGPGFGGSCLPKDIKALINTAKTLGYTPKILKSVLEANDRQVKLMYKKIRKTTGRLKNKTVTVLGIAFKPGTDDIRDASSISIIKMLLDGKAAVRVFDPQAMNNAKRNYPELDVSYCDDVYSACRDSDSIVLITEWEQFCNLDFIKLKSIVRTPVFIDLRNAYEPDYVKKSGFIYQGVGRK